MSEKKEVKRLQTIYLLKKELLAERGFDPRTSGLWASIIKRAPKKNTSKRNYTLSLLILLRSMMTILIFSKLPLL